MYQKPITKKLFSFTILCLFSIIFSGNIMAQSVNYSAKNIPLRKVLTEVGKQTGFKFAFSNTLNVDAIIVDVDAKNQEVISFFNSFFSKIGISYKIVGKTVSLSADPIKSDSPKKDSKIKISGKVEDDNGEPLIGASVVAGPGVGVSTLMDGTYEIFVEPGTKLSYEYIGFKAEEFIVPFKAEDIIHNAVLSILAESLDDIVVVAYGVKKKGTVTGSVSTVKSEKLQDVPSASFDQALQGQTPGLTVLSNSGEPSASATFSIRGTNSINSGTAPLFIMDGIQISSRDFNAINPSDIESISVLKDASSTSIYGARAANGVVVITTKRGRESKNAQISFRTQLGFSQLAQDNWSMMNTSERILYEKEVGLSDGKNYDLLSKIDVNWLDETFRKAAFLQNYNLQVTGANNKTRYFISGGFYDQEGIATDSDFQRYNFRSNISFQANKWLSLGANVMLTYEEFSESNSGSYTLYAPISAARFMMPYWDPYKEDGTYASVNDGSWKGTGVNPLEWAEKNPYRSKKYKTISSAFVEITPIKNLVIKSNAGIDYTHGAVTTSSSPDYKPNNNLGTVGRNSSDGISLTISNTVNYQFNHNDYHDFNFMIGQEGVSYSSDGFSITTSGQNNDKLLGLGQGTIARNWSSSATQYSYLSFFGRGEYNYANKYFVDFSVRTDASSRFGKKGRWAGFWSVGFMWNLHNEKFLKNINWITNAQIAASVGTSGNSSIPDYHHLALVSGGLSYYGIAAIAPYSKGNENLEWEKVLTSNIALRLGFFNRIGLDIEFYNKNTSNMLMAVPISYSDAGFGFQWDNIGGMVNRGVEFNFNADVVRTKDFRWNISANASYNFNKITELYEGANEYVVGTSGTKLVVGHSYGEFFMNRYAGVNAANGEPLWLDKDGNLTTEYRESDKVMIGKNYIAPWQGGFGTTLSWKGLSLNAQFSWVANKWMMNNDRYFEENSLFDNYNQSRRMLYDRWKQPGDITDIPKYGTSPQFDTHLLEDASFLRLKNLMISYSIPTNILNKSKFFTGIRIFAQGQNLFTFTKFSGLDPESTSSVYKAQYPMSRQFTFGAEITF